MPVNAVWEDVLTLTEGREPVMNMFLEEATFDLSK